ncbi:MAG: hypothetical protein ACJAYU_003166 [Bradymonadia bacterium]
MTGNEGDSAVELSPTDYFLLSRVDGRTPIRTLQQMGAIPADQFSVTFVKILASGLVRLPGVSRTEALDAFLQNLTGIHFVVEDSGSAGPTEPAPPPPPVTSELSHSASISLDEGTGSLESFLKATSDGGEVPLNEFAKRSITSNSRKYEPAPNRPARNTKKPVPKLALDLVPTNWPVPFTQFTFDPVAMGTGNALNDEQKKVVLYFHYHLRRVTYYNMLGIETVANRQTIKIAYFRLSKAFHPDRWYRQDTGEFGEMIEDVFKWLNRAYGVLSSKRKRKGYNKLISRGYIGEWQLEKPGAPQLRRVVQEEKPSAPASNTSNETSPEPDEPSPEAIRAQAQNTKRTTDVLDARARRAAADGDWAQACDLYLRLIEVNDTPDLRIRLVECMLKANMEPHEIDRHLSRATQTESSDLSVILLEAEVARRLDDLQRAEACFLQVLDLEPANPVARLGLERLGAGIPSA